ncbi:pyridoxamine 5'-phosphate oxidase family protein [Croceitalea rosinachiae]|uniref:Pyridoxamine 5'-phosphate oxidase family protein n=1 Tax=Croceitalea rosinachiae TaxID=3075596 RepID=A0ABU3AEF6_9FLAO|nr:pyridoxamine 5'-phosphate oxidase family protein [Croceitalea sp. F388]MDT0608577.1 pyridoxamine 5'-phosphate oxidase family protein [Croceitalea sp. F388]
MKQIIFQQLKNELITAGNKKGHPFRFFSLASMDNHNNLQQRTVVLRKVSDELELYFYTDKRSNKVAQLTANQKTSTLFYHPEKLLQLQIQGISSLLRDEKQVQQLWSEIPLNSRKDYATKRSPGSTIANHEEIDYLIEENNFCVIKIVPKVIEYLRLGNPNHVRIKYTKDNNKWKGQFLVP